MKNKNLLFALVLMLTLLVFISSTFALSLPKNVEITSISSTSKSVDDSAEIEVTLKANYPGTYYVEAGLQENTYQAFSIVEISEPSKCDGNIHYAGALARFIVPGETKKLRFKMQNYGKTGTYTGVAGVYTNCLKDGGITIDSKTVPVKIVATETTQQPPQILVPEKSDPKTLSGYFNNVVIPKSITNGVTIPIKGQFVAESDGKYYIEFGMAKPKSTFSVVSKTASASECDGSLNYAGAFYDLKAGDTATFDFFIKGYGSVGTFEIVGGVYSDCGKDAVISYPTQNIQIEGFPEEGGEAIIPTDLDCREGDIKTVRCPSGKEITSAECLNNQWQPSESCVGEAGGKLNVWLLIAVIAGVGIVIYLLIPKKRKGRRR